MVSFLFSKVVEMSFNIFIFSIIFDSNCFLASSIFLSAISFFVVNFFILKLHSDNKLSISFFELFNLLYSSIASFMLYFLNSTMGNIV